MYNILIVDDEHSVVDALTEGTDWTQFPINQVFCAYSGKEALQIVNTESIDVVLTDIQMPGISGLELIRQLRRMKKRMKIIVLTGHADFKYVREALQSEVSDYLLKPLDDDIFENALRRAVAQLAQEWEAIVSHQRVSQTLREHLPALRSSLLSHLLEGVKYGDHKLRERLDRLQLPFRVGGECAMLMLRLEEPFLFYEARELELIEYAVLNILEEVLGDAYQVWGGKDSHDYLILLIQHTSEEDSDIELSLSKLERLIEEVQSSIRMYLRGEATAMLSGIFDFPTSVAETYNRLLLEMRRTTRGGKGAVRMLYNPEPVAAVRPLQSLYEPPTLLHLLESARWLEAEEKTTRLVREIQEQWVDSPEHMEEAYYALSAAFLHFAHQNGCRLADLVDMADINLEGTRRRSAPHIEQWAKRLLGQIRERLECDERETSARIVRQVRQFVEQHINQDVSLQTIASQVFLNPGYLSKLYKNETGENLSDYITRIRLERTVYYLNHTNKKIQEICELLGYQSTSYFIRMFKKHFGMTPQDYRNSPRQE